MNQQTFMDAVLEAAKSKEMKVINTKVSTCNGSTIDDTFYSKKPWVNENWNDELTETAKAMKSDHIKWGRQLIIDKDLVAHSSIGRTAFTYTNSHNENYSIDQMVYVTGCIANVLKEKYHMNADQVYQAIMNRWDDTSLFYGSETINAINKVIFNNNFYTNWHEIKIPASYVSGIETSLMGSKKKSDCFVTTNVDNSNVITVTPKNTFKTNFVDRTPKTPKGCGKRHCAQAKPVDKVTNYYYGDSNDIETMAKFAREVTQVTIPF